ncbi:MAG: metallophosphoesterase [Pseudomonadota bacterium]
MQFKLAHMSDIHLGPLPPVTARQLMSKRITGYINWQRNRAANMGLETLQALTEKLSALKTDHTVVTGDLTNLALEDEFIASANWLKTLGSAETVSVVPGNHDAYTPNALATGLPYWAPWMTDDKGQTIQTNADFPYVRTRGKIMIIGCSSAVATPAFVAAGRFGEAQAKKLRAALNLGKAQNAFRVVLIHHPPIRNATKNRKRLFGISGFQSVIAEAGAELVLHGHTHLPQRHWIDSPNGKVPVFGVHAASEAPGGKRPAGAFNLFKISASSAGDFRASHEEWSVTTRAGNVEKTEETQLY